MLVTGASGYLGGVLVPCAAAAGWTVVGTCFAAPPAGDLLRLDIRDRAAVRDTLRRVRADVVVDAASGRDDWTAVADGSGYVAAATAALGARLVHLSSDALFSGRAVHYDETAVPDPVYPYGAAKAAAETVVRAVAPDAAVVRTSLILGDGRGNHELLTHALAAGRAPGALFTDEIRTP